MIMKKFSFLIVLFSIFLTSCQSIKDGLSGSKSENSDEFLVQKKNHLVMPGAKLDGLLQGQCWTNYIEISLNELLAPGFYTSGSLVPFFLRSRIFFEHFLVLIQDVHIFLFLNRIIC